MNERQREEALRRLRAWLRAQPEKRRPTPTCLTVAAAAMETGTTPADLAWELDRIHMRMFMLDGRKMVPLSAVKQIANRR